jgi:fructokinase
MGGPFAIGVDLGGTKIEAIVLEGSTERARTRVATRRDEGYDAIVARAAGAIRDVARDAGIAVSACAIGVGMPGNVTRRDGLVKNSNTICLNGRPFRDDPARPSRATARTRPGEAADRSDPARTTPAP